MPCPAAAADPGTTRRPPLIPQPRMADPRDRVRLLAPRCVAVGRAQIPPAPAPRAAARLYSSTRRPRPALCGGRHGWDELAWA